ncbi:MAG: twin-arginine translocase subunit TatC [Deltaproteobacteria bacterium]|nr:twin-arginine translocase subunit TatC [Deltaproteobacteria bacterium]
MSTTAEETRQPLTDHLDELRRRIIRALIALGVGTALCYNFAERIYSTLLSPLTEALPADSHLIFTELTEAFLTYFKMSLWGGFVLSSPVIFYQAWRFVSPGLYQKERKLFLVFASWSTLGFLAGMMFAYFVAVPAILSFFLKFGRSAVIPMPSMRDSLSIILRLLFIFGVMFELPLVLFLAGRGGIVTPDFLRKWRKGAVLGAFLLAAVLTPPDAVSQIMIAFPLYALFEIGILLCALGARRRASTLPGSPA